MLERKGPSAWIRDAQGAMVEYPFALLKYESVLSQMIEPHLYPEISAVRQQILRMAFLSPLPDRRESPLRQPQIGSTNSRAEPRWIGSRSSLADGNRDRRRRYPAGDHRRRIQRRSAADRERRKRCFRCDLEIPGLVAPAVCPRVLRWATAIPLSLRGSDEPAAAHRCSR